MSTSNWIYGCVASSGPIRSGGFQQLVITGVAGVDGSLVRVISFFAKVGGDDPGGRAYLSIPLIFIARPMRVLWGSANWAPHFGDGTKHPRIFLRENKITERVNFCLSSSLLVFIAPPMGVFWGRRQLGSPILVEADYHLKVFGPTLIWTGCSPDGEIPLYSCMRLNYPSCDRLLLTSGAP